MRDGFFKILKIFMKITIIANTSWYIFNFRFNLIKELIRKGHEVQIISSSDGYEENFLKAGIKFIEWRLDSRSLNIFKEIISFNKIFYLLNKNKSDLILSYTPKGTIYSGLISRILGIKLIANISGLGAAFVEKNIFKKLFFKMLYKLSLKRAWYVFFQNYEDMSMFKENHIVTDKNSERIPGSGVDLERFKKKTKTDLANKEFTFLLISRLIWPKGIKHYVEASKLIKKDYPGLVFNLLGFIDEEHPEGISKESLEQWQQDGLINFLGQTDDVRDYLGQTNCLVLPSYYKEGVPRTLLEAASMEIPIITTDHPGCRDAVQDGLTGYLCLIQNTEDLVDKMIKVIKMPRNKLVNMGKAGRKFMKESFNEKLVINRYVQLINKIE